MVSYLDCSNESLSEVNRDQSFDQRTSASDPTSGRNQRTRPGWRWYFRISQVECGSTPSKEVTCNQVRLILAQPPYKFEAQTLDCKFKLNRTQSVKLKFEHLLDLPGVMCIFSFITDNSLNQCIASGSLIVNSIHCIVMYQINLSTYSPEKYPAD